MTDDGLRDRILPAVVYRYRMRQRDLMSSSQRWEIQHARSIAMYLFNTLAGVTFTDIARMFRCSFTKVADAVTKIEDMRDDPAFDAYLGRLEERIKPREGPPNENQRHSLNATEIQFPAGRRDVGVGLRAVEAEVGTHVLQT